MKTITKIYFGNIVVFKAMCPNCNQMAIIIDNRFQCCNSSAQLEEVEKFKKKRESITYLRKCRPPKKQIEEILRHQNYQCLYCGKSLRGKVPIEFDHFVPFTYTENKNSFVGSCRTCNRIKQNFLFNSIEEARIYILSKRKEKRLPIEEYYGGGYIISKI